MTIKKVSSEKINSKFHIVRLAEDFLNKRQKENLSLKQVAKTLGVSLSSAFRIESANVITIDTLVKVCNWLGVNVQHYFIDYKKK